MNQIVFLPGHSRLCRRYVREETAETKEVFNSTEVRLSLKSGRQHSYDTKDKVRGEMKRVRQRDIGIESRLLRAVISVMIASIFAHIPMIFSFLLFYIPFVERSDILPVGIILVAVIASLVVGIGSFRWIYKRLGTPEISCADKDPHNDCVQPIGGKRRSASG
jgi:hypothetical protein